MGFTGQILVGRGEAFVEALRQFWDWDEEVSDDWQLRDDWRAVCVRTPAEDGELAELAATAQAPVLACLVLESDTADIEGISGAGRWKAELQREIAAKRPDTVRAAVAWAGEAGLIVDVSQVEEVLSIPWKPQAEHGFFALLAALGIADHEPPADQGD